MVNFLINKRFWQFDFRFFDQSLEIFTFVLIFGFLLLFCLDIFLDFLFQIFDRFFCTGDFFNKIFV